MGFLTRAVDTFIRGVPGDSLEVRAAPVGAAGGLLVGGSRVGVSSAIWPDDSRQSLAKRAYALAVVQACIDAVARDVSAAPLRVYVDGEGGREVDDDHEARWLVRSPNPTMSESEFWYYVVAMAMTTGFCVIEKVRANRGAPVQLWPLVSPWLKVRPKAQAAPDWEYRVPGNDPWPLAAEDVAVFTYRPDPMGGHTGRTPLSSLTRELAIDTMLTDHLNVLLERGGTPPLGLRMLPQEDGRIPQIGQAEADALVEKFRQRYGGSHNWDRPVFLGGLAVERIGLDLGEMLYPDLRDYIELHICTALGVPAGMVGTRAGLERNTYSNAETDLSKYYDGTIAPLWSRLDGAFTRSVLPEFDTRAEVNYEFDTSEIAALQDDEQPRWERATSALNAGGLMLDEFRAEIGLPPLPSQQGQVYYLPFSVQVTRPADLLILAGETAAPPQPIPAALDPDADDEEDDDDEDTAAESDDDTAADDAERARRGAGYLAAWPHPIVVSRRGVILKSNKLRIAKLTRQSSPKLRAFWRKQGGRIAEVATRGAVDLERRDLSEIDWAAEQAALEVVMMQVYDLCGETSFDDVGRQLRRDLKWDIANPNIRAIRNRLATRIVGINDTTREHVRDIVTRALDEGTTMPKLADQLRGLFEETYRNRAMAVARTESQVGYNSANVVAYRESGAVAYCELLDNPDHDTDPGDDGLTCAERNGMIVPLEQAQTHIDAEHPNGTLAVAPVLLVEPSEEGE